MNLPYNRIRSTISDVGRFWRTGGAARARAISSSIARDVYGADKRAGFALKAGVLGGVGAGAGYLYSDRGNEVGGSIRGAGLGVLAALGHSAYRSPTVRGAASGAFGMLRRESGAMGRGLYRRGMNALDRRANIGPMNFSRIAFD